MRRALLPIALILLLAPGLWWRETTLPPVQQTIEISRLPLAGQSPMANVPRLVGAWRLTGPQYRFGGFSALLRHGDGLLAISDAGWALQLQLEEASEPAAGGLVAIASDPAAPKWDRDIESATRAPDGTIWLGYESSNSIARSSKKLVREDAIQPAAMQGWPSNSGAEAMARLADGRFVVISEDTGGFTGETATGLLFPADPVSGAAPITFGFRPPAGYAVTDMAALPDGRLLILLRGIDIDIPPSFSTRLVLADPVDIAVGEALPWRSVELGPEGFPSENYEGLAVEPSEEADQLIIWMISDDNFAAYQRTLLLRWEWTPPAREPASPLDAEKAQTQGNAPLRKQD